MDPFIQACEIARRRLESQERQRVSWREVIRRAGYTEKERARVAYHLDVHRHDGSKPHHVPAQIVERFAKVLGISEDEMVRAAQVAAGYTPSSSPLLPGDLIRALSTFLHDDHIPDREKDLLTADVLGLLADGISKRARREG